MRKIVNTLIAISFTNLFFGQVQTYHDTQGKLEVTNSGQATYTLPIALPPSIQDVGPTINLVYASGQMGGAAGQGWNISGVSTINRIATRRDIDGFVDGVDFDDNDKLALDGQRLLLKTGTYLVPGSTYETEIQSNTKIEMIGTADSMEFIVTATDGSRSWYHGVTGCSSCYGYHLNMTFYIYKYEDANGNIIEYKYNPTGYNDYATNQYIREIYFSKNINGNPTFLNKVKFGYVPASRTETSYVKGVEWKKIYNLKYVEVYTNLPNDALFRKYDLTYYPADFLGYDRLQKITEYNGAMEAANPVEFEYNATGSGISLVDEQNTNNFYDENILSEDPIAGDFNGDGRLDFASKNLVFLFYNNPGVAVGFDKITLPFNISKRTTILGNSILNNKIVEAQSIISVTENISSLEFKSWSNYNTSILKTINFDNSLFHDFSLDSSYYGYSAGLTSNSFTNCLDPDYSRQNKYLSGDFNGDGFTEVLIVKKLNQRYYYSEETLEDNEHYFTQYTCTTEFVNDGENYYILDLKPSSSISLGENGFVNITNLNSLLNITDSNQDTKYIIDANSDGKDDVLSINSNGNYKIVGFKQLTISPWIEAELLGQGNIDKYSTDKQLLFGDYNGDSMIDIMLPEKTGDGCEDNADCKLWHTFYGIPSINGFTFSQKQTHSITDYMPKLVYGSGHTFINEYHAIDINKDGKSDLVRFEHSIEYDYGAWQDDWRIHTFINNIGNLNNSTTFINDYVSDFINSLSVTVGIFGSFKGRNNTADFVVYRQVPLPASVGSNFSGYPKVYRFNKNSQEDSLLKKVNQSNQSIVDEIFYNNLSSNLNNGGYGSLTDFYSSSNILEYPFKLIKHFPNSKIVSQLKNTNIGIVRYQDYKYHGLIANIDGLGIMGFNKTARSSWYRTNSDKKTWTVTQIDPNKRGAILNTYSQMLDGSISFSFTNNAINPSTISGLMSKTENTYFSPTTDNSSKKYTLLLQNQKTTDYITDVVNETIYEYSTDGYNLPSSVISKNYLGTTLQGTTTTTTLFDNVITGTGSGYYIGRPTETTTTVTAYGNSHTTNEKLFYTNGNITRKEKKVGATAASIASATETLIEIMDYFPNWNLKLKTISSSGFPVTVPPIADRTVSYTYDPTNRFIKTTTDAEGLVTTNDSYHPLYGLPLSQTNNTLAQTTTSIYDNWGKRTKVTDFLGKYIDYIYTKSSNTYRITENGSDGSSSYIENDALSRVIKKAVKNINNVWSYTSTEYDWLGRKYRESEPYFETETPKWNTISYDDYSRPIQVNAFTLKFIVYSYDGLTTTTNDGILIKTTTKNSNGHLVSSSEVGTSGGATGGTITYTYNALGNLLTSVYDGSTVTMQYDLWGRKTSINDPSAGLYTYTYNAYGEVLKETSPKGFTDYTYTPTGKILTKWVKDAVTPLNTNIKTTYNYDLTYKWISSMSIVNPFDGNSTYTYTYDIGTANGFTNTKQLKKTVETLTPTGAGTVTFTKDLSFDGFGRVLTETSTATAHGKTSTKTITNSYINGELYQIFDGATATGTPIWKANTLNARGQLLTGSLGNGISISNEYDQYGYPKKIKHDKFGTIPLNIITLDTEFTNFTGNLKNRTYSNQGRKENFEYDSLDRLNRSDIEEETHNLQFTSSNEGFVTFDTLDQIFPGSATQILENGKLKVTASGSAGVEKMIFQNAVSGTKLKVQADLNIISASGNCGIFLPSAVILIKEINPTTQTVLNQTIIENNAEYTVTQDSTIMLCFINNNVFCGSIFTIDNIKVIGVIANNQTYHNSGKINENYLGTYNYNKATETPPKPFQNTSVTLTDEGKAFYGSKSGQVISYNAIQRPIQITEGTQKIDFGYNTMQQRMVMYYGNANANKTLRPYRKYYSADGSMEINYTLPVTTAPTAPAKVEFFTYIGGDAYSAPIVNRKIDTATSENFYLHRDYQGSILAITNSVGAVVEKRVFDAWGTITKVQDGAGNALTKLTFIDRGYTGHEHLQAVGLINMNARLYDPKLRRLLQPDNFIQDPTSTQDYNRYAYAHNNPLKYVDLDGNNPAILIGIGVALISYFATVHSNHQKVTFNGVFEAVFWGAFSGAVSFGIGEVTQSITTSLIKKAVVQSVLHGSTQGGISSLQGGKFWSSFAAGSISSLAASGWSGIGGNNTGFGMIAFGTISGGAGAALTGGNFWQGAVTGLVVSGLNHGLHGGFKTKTKYTYRDYKTDADGNVTSEKLVYFKNNAKERLLYDQAVSEPLVDGQLSIYGHGNAKFIQFDMNSVFSSNHLLTADYTLYNDSSMYRNFVDNGGALIMNFKSCHTGAGTQNIAEQLSKYRSGLSIHAAADFWRYDGTIQNNAGYNQFINGVKVGWDLKR